MNLINVEQLSGGQSTRSGTKKKKPYANTAQQVKYYVAGVFLKYPMLSVRLSENLTPPPSGPSSHVTLCRTKMAAVVF